MLNWLKNLLGVDLNDEQMQQISKPTLELYTHIAIKDVQAFGLLGTVFAGPIAAAMKAETRNWPGMKAKMTTFGRNGVILGLIAGPLMTWAKVRTCDNYGVWDRCYRLRYNRNQVRVDRFSIVFAVGGAGVGYGLAGSAMFGGLVGMSTGILLGAIYNAQLKEPSHKEKQKSSSSKN